MSLAMYQPWKNPLVYCTWRSFDSFFLSSSFASLSCHSIIVASMWAKAPVSSRSGTTSTSLPGKDISSLTLTQTLSYEKSRKKSQKFKFHTLYVQLHQDRRPPCPGLVVSLWQFPRRDSIKHKFAESEDTHGGRGVLFCVGVITHDASSPLLLMFGLKSNQALSHFDSTGGFHLWRPQNLWFLHPPPLIFVSIIYAIGPKTWDIFWAPSPPLLGRCTWRPPHPNLVPHCIVCVELCGSSVVGHRSLREEVCPPTAV